jgi:hypothetical protein
VARHPSALSRWCIRRRRSGCITSKSGIPTKSTTRSRGARRLRCHILINPLIPLRARGALLT